MRQLSNCAALCLPLALPLSLLLSLPTARAQAPAEADWQRCRALAEPAPRLACYDALVPMRKDAVAPAPNAAPTSATLAAPAAASAPNRAAQEAAFGRPASEASQAAQLRSHLPGPFDGWEPRQRFTLANGQVWQLVEDSRGAYNLRDPKVTIRRAALGSFMMDIDGVNQTLRVRRVN